MGLGLDRRQFLKSAILGGAGATAATILLPGEVQARPGDDSLGAEANFLTGLVQEVQTSSLFLASSAFDGRDIRVARGFKANVGPQRTGMPS